MYKIEEEASELHPGCIAIGLNLNLVDLLNHVSCTPVPVLNLNLVLMYTSPKFRISRMGTAYGLLGEEYGISTPENLVKGLAYVRTANPLEGFCKCTDTSLLFEAARVWGRPGEPIHTPSNNIL